MQEQTRERIAELLHAHVATKTIIKLVGVSESTVTQVKRSLANDGDLTHKPRGPPVSKKLLPDCLEIIKSKFEAASCMSMRKMAKEEDLDEKTICTAIKQLSVVSRIWPHHHLLTFQQQERHLKTAKHLLWHIKKTTSIKKIFSDKMFMVEQVYNRRNDRCVVHKHGEAIPVMQLKHPAGVMVLGVISSDGKKAPLIFFDCGIKITAQKYLRVLQDSVEPWLKENYPEGGYVWQQDGAPAHTSCIVQAWISEHFDSFWPKDLWPPSSPDLNPLDYSVWSELERKACNKPYRNVDDLKASLLAAWDDLSPEYIVKASQSFRPHLEAIVKARGGHIE